MRFIATELPGVLLIEPDVYRDPRGFFLETYQETKYHDGGISEVFVQDNHSRSVGPILRGLHLQLSRPQGKLVRVVEGEIFDVAVDLRRGSPHFGRWVGFTLSAGNFFQCYIPPGFAHGFCVTGECAQVEYKCTALYDPRDELSIRWSDPDLAVRWPLADPLLSPKDGNAPTLAEVMERLPSI